MDNMKRVFLLIAVSSFLTKISCENDPCKHPIYCIGGPNTPLDIVNGLKIYNDSKTFVDMPLKFEPDEVLRRFREIMEETSGKPDKKRIELFLNESFEKVGNELITWTPSDWAPNPNFISKISDETLKDFGRDLHSRWKDLGRKVRDEVKDHPNRHSEIHLNNPFIVPGGRFREMYYWDSYWTILGLLVSEMPHTVKGMLDNFVQLIETYGHIPNGNRIYFINRSQPPLFISMVNIYYEATNDRDFLRKNIQYLEKEYQFWEKNRKIEVEKDDKKYQLFRYNVNVETPRPESYEPDVNVSHHFGSEAEKKEFYRNMRSGAESGWDYSTKWFIKGTSNIGVLADTKTTQIIPVELNSYICKNSRLLANFFKILGDKEKENKYNDKAAEIRKSIETVLWNEDEGVWLDYDIHNNIPRKYFYPSNIAPLWAECFSESKGRNRIKKVKSYLKNHPAMKYLGGVPTSMVKSGQQWDLSNAWPPLQEILVTALENTNDPELKNMAFTLVQKWVNNNWLTYNISEKVMFEKYDVEKVGVPGRGGEYEVVKGFGWTNGVMLHLLDKYGDRLADPTVSLSNSFNLRSSQYLVFLAILIVAAANRHRLKSIGLSTCRMMNKVWSVARHYLFINLLTLM